MTITIPMPFLVTMSYALVFGAGALLGGWMVSRRP